jgi:predicted nucleotidyltransferase
MISLFLFQVETLRQLEEAGAQLGAEIALIGASAMRMWLDVRWFTTDDVDVAVAVELVQLRDLEIALENKGWEKIHGDGQRWKSSNNTIADILPAGERLRSREQTTDERGAMLIDLTGFEHVFNDAVVVEVAENFSIKVIPLTVLMLLKIVAYLENPYRRAKDGRHIAILLESYASRDRRFSNEVVQAGIPFAHAGAFLLGFDLRALCDEREAAAVRQFIRMSQEKGAPDLVLEHRIDLEEEGDLDDDSDDEEDDRDKRNQRVLRHLQVFSEGFETTPLA